MQDFVRPHAARLRLWQEHRDLADSLASRSARRRRALADDLAQAAHVALWEAAGRWDEFRSVPFVAYAIRSIRFALADEARAAGFWGTKAARARLKGHNVPAEPGTIEGDHRHPAPTDDLACRDLATALLAVASPRQQEALRLYYYDGLSGPEASARMGFSAHHGRDLRADGLARMRRRAAAMGLFDE